MNQSIRQKAEAILREQYPLDDLAVDNDLPRIIHELQVHQIELELQNDELRRAHRALEQTQKKYFDLFNFAPVGYLTLDEKGVILDTNLAGAEILKHERKLLHNRPFMVYLDAATRPVFVNHLDAVFKTKLPQDCELTIQGQKRPKRYVRLRSVAHQEEEGQVCRTVMTNITDLRLAEEARQASEAQLRLALEAASLSTWYWEIPADKISWPDQKGTTFDPPPVPPVGSFREYYNLINPDDLPLVKQAMATALQGQPLIMQHRVIQPDGSLRWVEVRGKTRIDSTGKPVRMAGTVMDITTQKEAELALQASEALNRAIIDGLSANIVVLDETGKIIAVNQNWLNFVQECNVRSAARIDLGAKYLDIYRATTSQDESATRRVAENIEAILTGQQHYFELEYPCHASNKQRWYVMRVTPLGGAHRGAIVAHEDITDRKVLDETLRENEARFRLLTEKASDLICLHEPDGHYLYLSPSCERLLGYKPEELLGQNPYELFHPEDIEHIQTAAHDRARRGQEIISVTYRIRRKSGEYVWFETYTQPVENDQGQVTRLITASRNVTERYQAEERYRLLFEEAPLIDVITRLEEGQLIIADCNRCFLEIMNCSKAEIVNRPLANFYTPESQAMMLEENGIETAQTGQFQVSERQFVTRNGQVIDTLLNAIPWYNNGQLIGTRAMYVDVTKQKQAERELRAIQTQLKHVTDLSPVTIYALKVQNQTVEAKWVSAYVTSLLGFTIEEVLAPNWWLTYLHPEDREQAIADMADLFEANHLVHEYRFRHKDGSYLWIRDELRLLRDESGKPAEIIGSWADTSYRKQGELALREERASLAQRVETRTLELVQANQSLLASQQRMEALYEFGREIMGGNQTVCNVLEITAHSINAILRPNCVLIYLLDVETQQVSHFVKAGPGAAETSPVSFEELQTGLTGWVIRHGKQALSPGHTADPGESEARQQRRAGLKGEAPLMVIPLKLQGPVMGLITVANHLDGALFSQDDVEMIGAVAERTAVALKDINLTDSLRSRTIELSTANAELARASRLKDEFVANMSHELRTPLNAILGMAEVLQMETFGSLNEKQLNSLKHIEEGGQHLLTLINDILDLSKIEAGMLDLLLESTFIMDVCEASMRFVQQSAHKKQIELIFDFDDSLESLEVDERRLKQILVNLLTNAVKFTSSGGQVGLKVTRVKDSSAICFTVWDTGIGIAAEDLPNLFKPFVQLDSSLDREHGGTGLGLVLVYRLAELHGGSVSVESVVGQGSRFTVSIPWRSIATDKQKPGSSTDAKLPDTVPANPPTVPGLPILLVEDNEANIKLVRDFLQFSGYSVTIARNGYEAIEMAREQKPAIILMDIQMPGMDGLEAIRNIRADQDPAVAQVPIIALTALAMTGDKERCLSVGANSYISKPASMQQLIKLIEDQTTAAQNVKD